MSAHDIIEQMEKLATVQDELHNRALEELRQMRADQDEIASFLERSIELRNLRSAAIVEAAALIRETETGKSILDLFREPITARTLQ